ncbi:N-acetyltransferase [Methanosarcina hadiensis]|uniref:GNAT family N-acetyltransferase n=1 Tax=Methanosarcina hadiensis TaxID=3078083 RepID=UPI00397733A3
MGLINIRAKPDAYLRNISNLLRDIAGAYLLKDWKQIEKENVETSNDIMLPEILRIQAEGFKYERQGEITKHSKKFREIFYVIKNQDKIVGYCAYYLKPMLSFKGLKKKSVIFSIAIDKEFRHKGFGRKLLEESIKEMKVNNVSAISLYVNINNTPAVKLYEKSGFLVVKEVENVCGKKERCYKMEFKLF